MEIDFLYRAVKYVDKVFNLFDSKTGIESKSPSAYEYYVKSIERLHDEINEENAKSNQSKEPNDKSSH